jgi:hypothetical protein
MYRYPDLLFESQTAPAVPMYPPLFTYEPYGSYEAYVPFLPIPNPEPFVSSNHYSNDIEQAVRRLTILEQKYEATKKEYEEIQHKLEEVKKEKDKAERQKRKLKLACRRLVYY